MEHDGAELGTLPVRLDPTWAAIVPGLGHPAPVAPNHRTREQRTTVATVLQLAERTRATNSVSSAAAIAVSGAVGRRGGEGR
jgi:hypothetical protein